MTEWARAEKPPEEKTVIPWTANVTTYMHGIAATARPLSLALMGSTRDDTVMFGVKLGAVLQIPRTRKERDLAIGFVSASLSALEKAVADARATLLRIRRLLEEKIRPPTKELPTEKPRVPPTKMKAVKLREAAEFVLAEELVREPTGPVDEGRVARKRLQVLGKGTITSSWLAMERPWPESVVDAISMVLYVPRHQRTDFSRQYSVLRYLGQSFNFLPRRRSERWGGDDDVTREPSWRRTAVTRNLQPVPGSSVKEVRAEILLETNAVLPDLSLNTQEKTLDIRIPMAYVKEDVTGLSRWNNMVGYTVYIRLVVENPPRSGKKEVLHFFANLEIEHSSEQRKEDIVFSMSAAKGVAFGDGIEHPWRKGRERPRVPPRTRGPVKLFGSKKHPNRWVSASVDVTRLYLNSEKASVAYRKFQGDTLKARSRQIAFETGSVLTLGLANDEKMVYLIDRVGETFETQMASPVDFVTDRDMVPQ